MKNINNSIVFVLVAFVITGCASSKNTDVSGNSIEEAKLNNYALIKLADEPQNWTKEPGVNTSIKFVDNGYIKGLTTSRSAVNVLPGFHTITTQVHSYGVCCTTKDYAFRVAANNTYVINKNDIEVFSRESPNGSRIDRLVAYGSGFVSEGSASTFRDEDNKRNRQEREEKVKAILAQAKDAFARWDNRLKFNYAIGDAVCTKNMNYFGNIEAITSSKFKVHVVGNIPSENGFFFSGSTDIRPYKRIDTERWFEKDEVGPCSYKEAQGSVQ
jgi:hypothetical protein